MRLFSCCEVSVALFSSGMKPIVFHEIPAWSSTEYLFHGTLKSGSIVMQVFLVFDLSASTVISVGGGWFQPRSRIRSVGPSLRTGIILLWYGFILFTLG